MYFLKNKCLVIFFITILFATNLFADKYENPIFFLSYSHNIKTNNLRDEQGGSAYILYKFLGLNWMTGFTLLNAYNDGAKLLDGQYNIANSR